MQTYLIRQIFSRLSILIFSFLLTACNFVELDCQETGGSVVTDMGMISTSNWMGQIYQQKDAFLQDIVIPGTHDSATYGITPSSDISASSGQWFYEFARPLVASFSLTQACDTETQLVGGNRYLDLRVEWHKEALWIVHGMMSVPLDEVLEDIRDFAEAHPQEIVILDFQKVPNADRFPEMHDLLQSYLSDLMISDIVGLENSIQSIWDANEGNLITLVKSSSLADYSEQYRLRSSYLESDWANSPVTGVVYEYVTDAITNRVASKLTVAQAVVTPNQNTIINGLLGGTASLFELSETLIAEIEAWVYGWVDSGIEVNIVMSDFYDNHSVVDAALILNAQE